MRGEANLRLAVEPSSEPSERLAFPFGEGGTERRSAVPDEGSPPRRA